MERGHEGKKEGGQGERKRGEMTERTEEGKNEAMKERRQI